MIATKENNLYKRRSAEDEEQQKIYQQLNQLDQKLKNKPFSRQVPNMRNPWDSTEITDETGLKNWKNGRSEAVMTTYSPNMWYFSEIHNQDIDEDSLFDCHNNFLEQAKHTFCDPSIPSKAIEVNNAKNDDEGEEEECSFGGKNLRTDLVLDNYSQILKQRNYVYKKQSERPLTSTKPHFVQKSTKQSNERKSLVLQKSRKKSKSQLNIQQNKQNLDKRRQNQKYNLKGNSIEQQAKVDQYDLNKFSTFQSFLTKAMEVSSQQKNYKKSKNIKEQNSLQCTFKPTILKKSSQMVKSTKNVVQRLSTLNQSKQKKPYNPQPPKPLPNKQRIQQLSQPRRLKTLGSQQVQEIPSFRPSLSKKSLQQMANCVYDVATRNQLWLQQKKQKLQRIKQEQELQRSKRQSCTYSPAICHYKGDNDPRFSRFGKQGIANYFQRLSGVNKNLAKSKGQQSLQNKQNKSSILNEPKSNYISKGKKQNYEEAVKQLHNRIMGLKI